MVSLRERCAYHEAGHAVAAITYGIPVISVSIAADVPHMLRGRYRAPHGFGLEAIVVLCLSGPASEELLCGQIDDGSDEIDLQMAREYLARRFNPLQAAGELMRLRDGAHRLVTTRWVLQRIRLLADQLLRCGTLRGEEIHGI